ncbi:hypothetical protein [Streptomyces griseoluteus]|uniref:hypothetical protein n=1 Tax=Streptomyces griseoluteus TaxID=29306 RepID=UPI003703642A
MRPVARASSSLTAKTSDMRSLTSSGYRPYPHVGALQAEKGSVLAGSVIRRAWRGARKAVLPAHVFESPTGKRVYDLRTRA